MRVFNFVAWTGVLILVAITTVNTVHATQTKQVCHDRVDKSGKPVTDKKSGKTAQDCKTIKIHEKVDGTPVPEKSTKKK
jgi:hypothetical protein